MVKSLNWLLTERKEKNDPIKTNNILSLSLKVGVIPYSEKGPGGNKAKEDLTAYILAYPGDIVLNSMNVIVGSVGLSKYFGAVSPVYIVLHPRSNEDSVDYFNAIFQNVTFQKSLYGLGNGIMVIVSKSSGKLNTIRMRIPMSKLKTVQLPQPNPSEQTAIVRYLGHMDRRIRRNILAKQKLIKLLEEQKQAIIHRAVTGQIDVTTGKPYHDYKPSGVEWLGGVPFQWKLDKIKRMARNGYKTFVDGDWIESPYIKSEGIRLIQTGNIGVGLYREKGFRYISKDTFDSFSCTEINPRDVLICRLGDPVGRACLAPHLSDKMITSVDVCILKLRDDINSSFVVYLMSSQKYLNWVGSLVRGSTRDRVSRSMLGCFILPIPTLNEQLNIVDYLDKTTLGIAKTIDRVKQEISLLREYRSRLFADAVTGKLDVRKAAAGLPEEIIPENEEVLEADLTEETEEEPAEITDAND